MSRVSRTRTCRGMVDVALGRVHDGRPLGDLGGDAVTVVVHREPRPAVQFGELTVTVTVTVVVAWRSAFSSRLRVALAS